MRQNPAAVGAPPKREYPPAGYFDPGPSDPWRFYALSRHHGGTVVQARPAHGRGRGAASRKSRRWDSTTGRVGPRHTVARSHVRQRHDFAGSGANGSGYRAWSWASFWFREI